MENTSTDATTSKDRADILDRDYSNAARGAARFLLIIAALAVAWELSRFIWVGLLPVLLAILVATFLWPVSGWLRRHKWPAGLAAATSVVGFLLVLGGVLGAMGPIVMSQKDDITSQAGQGFTQISDWLQGPPFNLDLQSLQLDKVINDTVGFLRQQSQSIISGVSTGVSMASSIGVTILVMLMLVFFILKDGDGFLPMIRRFTGEKVGWHVSEVMTRTWNTLSGYIRAQAAVSMVDAVFIGLGLVLLRVPLAFVLAVITFFAGFIPIVGAVTAGALAVVIALVTHGVTTALLVLLLIIAVQQLEGNVLSPILQSKAMNLHPAVVLLSVTVCSALWGIVGAFLAVPAAATIAVWLRYHSEMVALRAGQLTVDDLKIETKGAKAMSSEEAYEAVRDHLLKISPFRTAHGDREGDPEEASSTAASFLDEHKDDK